MTEELNNLYTLARRAKNDGNSENAQKYYEMILLKNANDWEAAFYSVYYQSMQCKIAEIEIASNRITNCEDTVFKLIKDNISDPDEQRETVDEVAAKLISISDMLFKAYKNHYDGIDSQIRSRYVQEYANYCSAARDIVYKGGNWIVDIFGDQYGDIAACCWELGVRQHNILMNIFDNKELNADIIAEYNDKISKYNPDYQPPETNMGGGCYIM